jgi:hypothetical protein
VRSLVEVVGEVALLVLAVHHRLLGLAADLLAPHRHHGGRVRGFGFALRISLVASLMVSIYLWPRYQDPAAIRQARPGAWCCCSSPSSPADASRARPTANAPSPLDRLGASPTPARCSSALHRVTQTLPASLDLDDVLDTTIGRLRGLFDFDFAAIFVFDETAPATGNWSCAGRRSPPAEA